MIRQIIGVLLILCVYLGAVPVQLSTGVVSAVVDDTTLRYYIKSTGGDPAHPMDDNIQLTHSSKDPGAGAHNSYTTIRVGGKDHIYGEEGSKVIMQAAQKEGRIFATYAIDDLEIMQVLSESADDQTGSLVRIEYELLNKGKAAVNAGVRICQELHNSSDDLYVYRIPGLGYVDKEYRIEGIIPLYWYYHAGMDRQGLTMIQRLVLDGSERPTRVLFADSSVLIENPWQTEYEENAKIKVPAVAVWFENITIGPGDTKIVGIAVGPGRSTFISTNGMNIKVCGMDTINNARPAILAIDLKNTRKKPANKLNIRLSMPEVLAVGIGETSAKNTPEGIDIANHNLIEGYPVTTIIARGEEAQSCYVISATEKAANGAYKYDLNISAEYPKGRFESSSKLDFYLANIAVEEEVISGGEIATEAITDDLPADVSLSPEVKKLLLEIKKEIEFSRRMSEALKIMANTGASKEELAGIQKQQEKRDQRIISLKEELEVSIEAAVPSSAAKAPAEDLFDPEEDSSEMDMAADTDSSPPAVESSWSGEPVELELEDCVCDPPKKVEQITISDVLAGGAITEAAIRLITALDPDLRGLSDDLLKEVNSDPCICVYYKDTGIDKYTEFNKKAAEINGAVKFGRYAVSSAALAVKGKARAGAAGEQIQLIARGLSSEELEALSGELESRQSALDDQERAELKKAFVYMAYASTALAKMLTTMPAMIKEGKDLATGAKNDFKGPKAVKLPKVISGLTSSGKNITLAIKDTPVLIKNLSVLMKVFQSVISGRKELKKDAKRGSADELEDNLDDDMDDTITEADEADFDDAEFTEDMDDLEELDGLEEL